MLSLKEAIENLEKGSTSWEDIQKRVLEAGCELRKLNNNCSYGCPLAQYLLIKTRKECWVGTEHCGIGCCYVKDEVLLPKNTSRFREEFDLSRRKTFISNP